MSGSTEVEVKARDLKVGDQLVGFNGDVVTVSKVEANDYFIHFEGHDESGFRRVGDLRPHFPVLVRAEHPGADQ